MGFGFVNNTTDFERQVVSAVFLERVKIVIQFSIVK